MEVKVTNHKMSQASIWSADRKITARAFELRAAQELQSLLREEISILPATLSDQIKPFQIGVRVLFDELAKASTTPIELKLALQRYTGATGYQMALGLDGSHRYRLDGSVYDLVSDDNREHARKIALGRLEKMRRKKANPEPDGRSASPAPEPTKPARAVLTINQRTGT
ncbi:hypothetical protein TH44_12270 [Thalassospira xiamenensis]|uniref:ProQ/FinO domain-containing protein n=1 Tax=Thalassospira xiamenensis TaxID=220697 RepID=A0A367XB79_9PROT|nr:hypothetical protein AUP41_16735 [Thalassospira xiamenensis]RCK50031.1 hypothetical protein TH44_12270 [Thalassospira xiamenensis]